MDKGTIKKILEYEFVTNLQILKRIDTWLYVLSIMTLFAVLLKYYLGAVIILLVIIILQMKRNYDSGAVTDYFRRKAGIPSRADIRNLKKENLGIDYQ